MMVMSVTSSRSCKGTYLLGFSLGMTNKFMFFRVLGSDRCPEISGKLVCSTLQKHNFVLN